MSTEITTQESPSRDELFKGIDFEIDRFTKEHSKPGWTEWAIYGALALIFWTIASFPYSESLSLIASAKILLTFWILHDCAGLFRGAYASQKFDGSAWITFHRQVYRISPQSQLATLLNRAGLLFIVLIASGGVWRPQVVIIVLWILLSIAALVYLFWLCFEDFPVSVYNFPQPRRLLATAAALVLIGLVALVVLWAVSGFFISAISQAGEPANAFKFAGLVFAAMFLFEKLFYEPQPRRVKDELTDIRRSLLVYEIDTERASYMLKKLLGKLSPQEYIQGVYEDLEDALKKYEWTLDRGLELWSTILDESEDSTSLSSIADDLKLKLLVQSGSDETIQTAAWAVERERKKFKIELKRTKQFMSLKLYEFESVENDIGEREARIEKKRSQLQAQKTTLDQPK